MRPRRLVVLPLAAAAGLAAATALAAPPTPQGTAQRVNQTTAGQQFEPAVAVRPDGSALVAWSDQQAGTGERLRVRSFAAGGAPTTGEVAVDDSADGRTEPVLGGTAADGSSVVVYLRRPGGAFDTLSAQRLSPAGVPVGPEIDVAAATTPQEVFPRVAVAPDGRFLVVWGYGQLRYRLFSAAGVPATPADQVLDSDNDPAGTYQDRDPSVDVDSAGRFVVAWSRAYAFAAPPDRPADEPARVMARRITASGSAPAGPFAAVTATGLANVDSAQVGAADDGAFVVAYRQSLVTGIVGQRVAANDAPVGGRLQLTDPTTDAVDPRVAMRPNGAFLLVWESRAGGASTATLRGFAPDGTPEADARSYGPGGNTLYAAQPAVATDAAGRSVAAFTGDDGAGLPGGYRQGVFLQRFTSGTVTQPPPTTTTTPPTTATTTTTTPPTVVTEPPRPPLPQPQPLPGPPATTSTAPSVSPLPSFAKAVVLPSTRRCVSRRRFTIRLRVPRGADVVKADVRVNGRSVRVVRGARLRSTVNLRGLPKGRFRVEIRLTSADGRVVKGTRRYRTCAVRRSGSRPRV